MVGWDSDTAASVGGGVSVGLTYNSMSSAVFAGQDVFPGIPAGWVPSWATNSVTSLSVTPGSVVVRFGDGDSQTFRFKDGRWVAPVPESDQLVTLTGSGGGVSGYRYFAEWGQVVDFDVSGRILFSTTAVDDRKPASVRYEWSGTTLSKITDPVSGRFIKLDYATGTSTCPGGVPSSMGGLSFAAGLWACPQVVDTGFSRDLRDFFHSSCGHN